MKEETRKMVKEREEGGKEGRKRPSPLEMRLVRCHCRHRRATAFPPYNKKKISRQYQYSKKK